MEDQTIKTYLETIEKVIQLYKSADFKVIQIRCDNKFKPLKETLKDKYGIEVNLANPNEHVPEAERNNRVIKERVRATYHRLPYNNLPKVLVKMMVTKAAKKLNFFPSKSGVSTYYSPRMIVHKKPLDYNKHCKYTTGIYVQSHELYKRCQIYLIKVLSKIGIE
jgi:hypothetical protein